MYSVTSGGEKKESLILMKFNSILFIWVPLFLIAAEDCFSQVSIQYENPAIFARSASGEIPTYQGDFEDQGTLIIDVLNTKLSMVSESNEQRKFEFHVISYNRASGHYLAYGENTMFTFLPKERIFNLMYKQNHVYVFELTENQNNVILSEMDKL